MCNTRVLCQHTRTTVSQCSDCGMFFIWHNNMLLSFLDKEYHLFLSYIKRYVFSERSVIFPDGEDRIIIHSSAKELSLAFEEDEWEEFKEALTEAAYLGNVYDILKGKN
ncbi:DUF6686 family protein [Olivibacter sp. SDN3]|uniref:DUF6686 family protein n=1 Tax=Olivibacter sp. SDN3 TaxID=2764720 RepID=UPI00351B7E97